MLYLATDAPMSDYIRPICLASKQIYRVNQPGKYSCTCDWESNVKPVHALYSAPGIYNMWAKIVNIDTDDNLCAAAERSNKCTSPPPLQLTHTHA